MLRKLDWLSLGQIQEAISKKQKSPYLIQQAYLESEALVLWVAKDQGESWIPRVITQWREHGGTFDEAFKVVLGVTVESELERLRHAWE